MKGKSLYLVLIAISILLTGCIPHESVEEAALINIAGYDALDDELTKGTVAIHHYGRSKEEVASEQYLTASAKTMKEIHAKLENQSSKPLRMGKISLTLFGEELAKNGLSHHIDFLTRDPKIGRDVNLGIVDGESQQIIEQKYNKNQPAANYLQGVIDQNSKRNLPATNLHTFLYAYFGKGVDGYLPYIKLEGENVKVEGIALFKKADFVSTIPYDDMFTFKIMIEDFNEGLQGLEYKGMNVVLDNIGSKVKYKLYGDKKNPKFSIDINMKGIVSEVAQREAHQKHPAPPELEKAFAHYFEQKAKKLVNQFKEENIDPLGLGEKMKNRKGIFDENSWEHIYADMPVDVNVTVNIVETGISY